MMWYYTNAARLQAEHLNMLPKVDMSTRGHSPSGDISTEGQHVWMFHEHPCFICFVVWPTMSKYKIPINNICMFYLIKITENYQPLK